MLAEAPAYAERMSQAGDGAFPVTIRRIVDPEAEADTARSRFGGPTAVWRHGDDALVGFGVAARIEARGPDRVRSAAASWRALHARAVVDSDVAGATPVAFGAFAFADASAAPSVLVLPRLVVVQREGAAYRIEVPALAPAGTTPPPPSFEGPRFAPEAYERAVGEAVARIEAGGLEKVVLARDLPVETPGFDLDAALAVLTDRYRGAWVFAVDGVFGASPETLATVRGGKPGEP